MTLFLILDPDRATQPLLIKPAEVVGSLNQLGAELRRGDQRVAQIGPIDGIPENEHYPCLERYGNVGVAPPRCINFALRPEHGANYRITVSASGHPSASATTTVPGDFRITSAQASGSPPGTAGLQVRWSPSAGAYRYIVAIRPAKAPRCVQIQDCDMGWFQATQDTVLQTTVPAGALEGGEGPFFIDVYAMDQALYEYLTTGTTGKLFPVGAVQNVSGGYGAVGAWVVRSHGL